MKLLIAGVPAEFANDELAKGYLLRHSVSPDATTAELKNVIARWMVNFLGAAMIPLGDPDLHEITCQVGASANRRPPRQIEWTETPGGKVIFGRAGGIELFRISREHEDSFDWRLMTGLPGNGYEGCYWPRMCEGGEEKLKEEAEGLLTRWAASVFGVDRS